MPEESQEAQVSESQTDDSSAATPAETPAESTSTAPAESTAAEPKETPAEKPAEKPAESETRTSTTSGVPEEYTLTLEDESPLSDEHMDEVAAYARKQGLSNSQAQEVLDRDSKLVEDFKDSQLQAWEKTQEDWVAQAKADKEIGGDRFGESAELAKRVLTRYAPDDVVEVMRGGYGNHPGLIKMFSRIGKELVEAKLITADGPVGKRDGRTVAQTLYGDTTKD